VASNKKIGRVSPMNHSVLSGSGMNNTRNQLQDHIRVDTSSSMKKRNKVDAFNLDAIDSPKNGFSDTKMSKK